MENSSKALLIAAGILIAVLLLSLFAYLYVTMSNFSDTYNENISRQKLQAFNAEFEVYNGQKNLTAQDVVSVANLAEENNKKNASTRGENDYIEVKIYGTISYLDINHLQEPSNKFTFMQDHIQDKFECSAIKYNSQSGRVNYIEFKKI